jgi:hypothetical protein
MSRPNNKPRITDAEIRKLIDDGHNALYITSRYCCSKERIAQVRITDDEIRDMLKNGMSKREVYRQHNVGMARLNRIEMIRQCQTEGCKNEPVDKFRGKFICCNCMNPEQTEEERQAIRFGANRSMIADCEEYSQGKPGLAGKVKSYRELGIRADMDFGRITR